MTTFAIVLYILAFAVFVIAHIDGGNSPRRAAWVTVPLGLALLTAALFIQSMWVAHLHYLNK